MMLCTYCRQPASRVCAICRAPVCRKHEFHETHVSRENALAIADGRLQARETTVARFKVDFNGVMDRLEELERENHRLATENTTMCLLIKAVANSNPYGSWYPATNSPAGVVCRWCMERAQSPSECRHDHECTWRQARAFVAQREGQGA